MKKYTSPIGLSSQYRFCGNSFRVDTYKGCAFRCSYCFVTSMSDKSYRKKGITEGQVVPADMRIIERAFERAIDEKEVNSKNENVQLIQQYVPLHVGGMSDPFQFAEWKFKNTFQLIEITNKYKYPAMFSTKTNKIPQEYIDILNPEIHSFQFSFSCVSQGLSDKWEKNTGSVTSRIELVKKLKSMGFWVSIRLQPVIDVDESIELINSLDGSYDFVSIEHLKLPADNKEYLDYLIGLLKIDMRYYKRQGREYELIPSLKIKNAEKIKAHCKSKVGFADNDLQIYSDTDNCCGIDTINSGFYKNWLKMNSMYILKNGEPDDAPLLNKCPQSRKMVEHKNKNFDEKITHKETVVNFVDTYRKKQHKKELF